MNRREDPVRSWVETELLMASSRIPDGAGKYKGKGVGSAWHLAIKPFLAFWLEYLAKGNILGMRTGLSLAVHRSVVLFSMNARVYELANAHAAGPERIRSEFNMT